MVVCTGEQCKEHGARELLDELREARRQHEGDLRVSSAKCIGHCTAAPAVIEDGSLLRWVSLRRLRSELIRLGIL
jgi:NADH:ubiquinone oxidoreductase subunit E